MTTIITRLYSDRRAARAVRKKLLEAKFREPSFDVISAREGEDRAKLESRLARAMVHADAVSGYAEKIMGGASAVVIRADYRPLGARRIAREIIAGSAPIESGTGPEEHEVKTPPPDPKPLPSVLTEHPLFLRIDGDPGSGREPQGFSRLFGLPTLTDWRVPGRSLTERHGPVMPFKALDDRPRKTSVMTDHPKFSERFGMPTLKER